MKPPRLIYIAGLSRSGSTIIAHYLSNSADLVDIGEFRRISLFVNEVDGRVRNPSVNGGCSCGELVADCHFWQSIEKSSGVSLSNNMFDSGSGAVGRIFFQISAVAFGARVTRFAARVIPSFRIQLESAQNCWKVFDAILSETGAQAVLDGSKQIHHMLSLYVARPDEIALIALSRNMRAVIFSLLKRLNKPSLSSGPQSLSVAESNRCEASLIKAKAYDWLKMTIQQIISAMRFSPQRREFLQYEEFCQNPEKVTQSCMSKFSLQALKLNNTDIHSIGGSPSKHVSEFEKVTLDESWKSAWGPMKEKNLPLIVRRMEKLLQRFFS